MEQRSGFLYAAVDTQTTRAHPQQAETNSKRDEDGHEQAEDIPRETALL